jgi:DinB superfamily
MPIMPDTKDWTWVLQRPCPECGFDPRAFAREEIGAMIRNCAEQWQAVLARSDVRTRPDDATWSPLEYACHVRDVFRLFDERLRLMLTEDDPSYANWDQDETAVAERYGGQQPEVVAGELAAAGEQVAARFDGVSGADWQRTGRRSDGASFTVETFARYFAHDWVHHLWDVTR